MMVLEELLKHEGNAHSVLKKESRLQNSIAGKVLIFKSIIYTYYS